MTFCMIVPSSRSDLNQANTLSSFDGVISLSPVTPYCEHLARSFNGGSARVSLLTSLSTSYKRPSELLKLNRSWRESESACLAIRSSPWLFNIQRRLTDMRTGRLTHAHRAGSINLWRNAFVKSDTSEPVVAWPAHEASISCSRLPTEGGPQTTESSEAA